VYRTVAVTLRRTVGGGAILALGVGALSSSPQAPIPVVASATASAQLPSAPVSDLDELIVRRTPTVATIYLEATPSPVASVGPARMAVAVVTSRRPLAVAAAARAARPVSAGGANAFTYGYCTWWVAHKRAIPWRGNAAQWWWNARAFGFAEGSSPRPGAIMVMGVSATSPDGHVAYVESVGSGGSFVVSEMNWWGVPGGGWGRVDYRTVTSLRGVLGFIY
jgi:peptidoglycan DL-endopeptidase CwlO